MVWSTRPMYRSPTACSSRPVFLICYSTVALSQIPRAYIAAGESLGVGERAKELARYAEGLLAEIDERLAQVPAEKRPLVYYARGPRGLQTGLKGSINVESLERIGARNIAAERMAPG